MSKVLLKFIQNHSFLFLVYQFLFLFNTLTFKVTEKLEKELLQSVI